MAQEQSQRTLTVQGQGSVLIPATIAQVNLGVEVEAQTAEAAQQQAARQSSAVVELLRSRNDVEKLQTTGVRLNPVYSRRDNQQVITGYRASNTVSFQIPTDSAGELLDTAVSRGATRIMGINFIGSDEAITQARDRALQEATLDARSQADVVLATLNLQRRDIVGINVNHTSHTAPPVPYQRMEAMAMDASTPIEGGEQEITASVSLEVRY
ncbi:SIMPL domain-containing protein [Phormidium yuhuli AB48]|uniref:SIMPL domain-containing protein n=1 Tax=Phormidium yuhuli AB48 TaxID=2940671 RepID=A0ABY5ATS9_9CYAN|nr:SIMPL domain-containing protein [Phormidium yuhuli]USR92227.1 SIMPL domain-containing protein [Phormidium yuhuli AB48]